MYVLAVWFVNISQYSYVSLFLMLDANRLAISEYITVFVKYVFCKYLKVCKS